MPKRRSRKAANVCSAPICEPDDKWRVRSALDTLTRAEEIRADRALLGKVKALAQDEQKRLARIKRLERAKL